MKINEINIVSYQEIENGRFLKSVKLVEEIIVNHTELDKYIKHFLSYCNISEIESFEIKHHNDEWYEFIVNKDEDKFIEKFQCDEEFCKRMQTFLKEASHEYGLGMSFKLEFPIYYYHK